MLMANGVSNGVTEQAVSSKKSKQHQLLLKREGYYHTHPAERK